MTTNTEFQDRTLTCTDCFQPFVWTASDQALFHEKGFTYDPIRCQTCRQSLKERAAQAVQKRGGKK